MSRPGLIVALASVFAGLTVFSTVLGFVQSPVALVLTVPFGVVTYLLWYHASGRLDARVHRQARTAGTGKAGGTTGMGGFGAGPREEWTGPGPRSDGRGFDTGARRGGPTQRTGPSTTEAYRTLGLDPGADESAVRAAYREKVKEVHPDTDDGSERAFKRVQDAYDRLSE